MASRGLDTVEVVLGLDDAGRLALDLADLVARFYRRRVEERAWLN